MKKNADRHFLATMDYSATTKCQRCGKCCLANCLSFATEEDLARWRQQGREDILHVIENTHAVWAGDHLISNEDGHYLHGCPFLNWEGDHYACAIYETRPSVCRNYQPGSSLICPLYMLRIQYA